MSYLNSKEIRLTQDGTFKCSPVFTKGGEEIVYVLLETAMLLRLMRLSVRDGKIEPVHDETKKSQIDPALSVDGRYLAYCNNYAILAVQVVMRDTQSNPVREISVPPGEGFSALRSPAVAPDGSCVLYCYAVKGQQHIYSAKFPQEAAMKKPEEGKRLTEGNGINNWPHFSPDGKEIVFSSTRDGNYEIYVMNADGSNVRRLTDCPLQDIRPKFSPDGKRIAFTSARDGNYEIYVMDRDGSNLQRVTNHPERDDYPDWHPDGHRLVTVSERNGRHDLYLMDVPTSPIA